MTVAGFQRLTRASILTRVWVVLAIVQSFIAKHASPALLADALPRSIAGSIHAARIPVALSTVLAGPADFATAFAGSTTITSLVMAARCTFWCLTEQAGIPR